MKVFLAGATGAIGRRLVPKLLEKGHQVFGTVRSADNCAWLKAHGATPVVVDLLLPEAVRSAVLGCHPDAIIDEGTAFAGLRDLNNPDRGFAGTNLLRTKGTDALLAAARALGTPRFIAQSYTGWPNTRTGTSVKTEDDPLDPHPLARMRQSLAAIEYLERTAVSAGGLVLRYGQFYGAPDDPLVEAVRRRRFPLVGRGGGVWSFVHLDDAADATVLALERGGPGLYNIVDDEPARAREWLPVLASTLGARPPHHVPRLLARLLAGEAAVMFMTEMRGASNAKAKRAFGWTLRYPSWRDGFAAAYGGDQGAPPRPDRAPVGRRAAPVHGAS
ncbi:MAG TPA: NAD-dependent epimerase/dehydratase family protein [Polyangia bacterium]